MLQKLIFPLHFTNQSSTTKLINCVYALQTNFLASYQHPSLCQSWDIAVVQEYKLLIHCAESLRRIYV